MNPFINDAYELYDDKILDAISKMYGMYENGELIEVADICWNIASAIEDCEKHFK